MSSQKFEIHTQHKTYDIPVSEMAIIVAEVWCETEHANAAPKTESEMVAQARQLLNGFVVTYEAGGTPFSMMVLPVDECTKDFGLVEAAQFAAGILLGKGITSLTISDGEAE